MAVPALALALALGIAALAQGVTPYKFKLGTDVTQQAAATEIKPAFRAVAGDLFRYEIYTNSRRSGQITEEGKPAGAFSRRENWIVVADLRLEEDELDGRPDLRGALSFEQMEFLVDDGHSRYAGYIGPEAGPRKSAFFEVLPGGERKEANNIPGWPGMNARTLNSNRETQSRDGSASAWFSISEAGRVHDEAYFADFAAADQRNYPGQLLDPVHLMLGLQPEFPQDAKLKLGETVKVTRRFPMGVLAGATVDYEVTYKLEKLYGNAAEPTAARFSFSAVPVARAQTVKQGALQAEFEAPEIKDGELLLDLVKGVSADVRWKYVVPGVIAQPGTTLRSTFEVEFDFRASLQRASEDEKPQ
ncbi:MAG: hypothetical protein IT463_12310 [Planctomycetes bacterium]|nr:hypothetical protein [Planctomycetota bacterium]